MFNNCCTPYDKNKIWKYTDSNILYDLLKVNKICGNKNDN